MRPLDALCTLYRVSGNFTDKILVFVYYSFVSTKFDVGTSI
jgi:hypothetical protein